MSTELGHAQLGHSLPGRFTMKSWLGLLAFPLACLCSAQGEDYQSLTSQGFAALEARQYPNAVDSYGAAFKLHAGDQFDYFNAASAAAQAGKTALAFEWLDDAFPAGQDWPIPLKAVTDARGFEAVRSSEQWPAFRTSLEKRLAQYQADIGAVKAELLSILDKDQKYRLQLLYFEQKYGRDSQQVRDLRKNAREADEANQRRVSAILKSYGWLGPKQVGPQAGEALFLVIQHADLPYQHQYLPLVRAAVKEGSARADELALLEDRVQLREGGLQVYGSQIYRDPRNGSLVVAPLEDPDHVDARRASVGLQPLAVYVKQWNITWNVEEYKHQLPALEASLAQLEK